MIDSYIFAIRILKYRVTKYQPIHGTFDKVQIALLATANKVYGTEYEIWADFGQVGNTEKKSFGLIISNF